MVGTAPLSKCTACGCAGATMSWISDPVCNDCFLQLVEQEMAEHADTDRRMRA